MELGHDDNIGDDQGKVREMHTRIDAKIKGMRYRSTTATEQHSGTSVMVYNKASELMVSLTLDTHEDEERRWSPSEHNYFLAMVPMVPARL
jgi:hypothetical protein